MVLSSSLRRLVVCAAALPFLACHGMVAAAAVSPSGAAATHAQCHDTGGNAGGYTGDGAASCRFQNASTTPPKIVYATIDLPSIVVAFDHFVPVVNPEPAVVSWLEQIEPPPLRILHCCLRN